MRVNFGFKTNGTANDRTQGYRIMVFPDTVPGLQYLILLEVFADFEATSA